MRELHVPAIQTAVIDPSLWDVVRNMSTCGKFCSRKRHADIHHVEIDWKKYTPDKYLIAQSTIVAGINTESDGHTITANSSKYINENGNAWTKGVIAETHHTFRGAAVYHEHCFQNSARVLMFDGTYKNIGDVCVGDKVINRLGEVDTVKRVYTRKSKDFVKLTSRGLFRREILATDNHPFFVFHARETCPVTGRKNNPPRKGELPSKKWRGLLPGNSHKKAQAEGVSCGWNNSWVKAGDLNPLRDVFTHPVPIRVEDNFELNEKRAKLIGWFLAEGNYMTNSGTGDKYSGVVFSFSAKEKKIAQRIGKILDSEFGHSCEGVPRINEVAYKGKPSSMTVSYCNKEAMKFFMKWCGNYSWKKKLHPDFIFINPRLQKVMVKALLNGDGTFCVKSSGYRIELTSRHLIQQLVLILWRLGINPTYKEFGVLKRYSELIECDDEGDCVYQDPATGRKKRPSYKLSITVRDSQDLDSALRICNKKLLVRERNRTSPIFSNGESKWHVTRIKSVEKVKLDDPVLVYNLEVEGDNSYVVEGVIVHNCQLPSMRKGDVLDSALREIKDGDETVLYVDILTATSRKHRDLVEDIERGQLNGQSMGTIALNTRCSRCGKIITDSKQNCEHMNQLLTPYYDDEGVRRMTAELCGIEGSNPRSNTFIEASWVSSPAFAGAVVSHFITKPRKTASVNTKNQKALVRDYTHYLEQSDERLRAASRRNLITNYVAAESLRHKRIVKIAKRV